MSKNSNTLIKRNPHLLTKEYEGQFIILDFNNGKLFFLNEMAQFIWEILKKPSNIEQIIKKITTNYSVETRQCRKDVLKTIKLYNNELFIKIEKKD